MEGIYIYIYYIYIYMLAMSTSAPILSADFPDIKMAGHAEDFQIYVFE